MNPDEHLFEEPEVSLSSLHRSKGTADFSHLLSPRQRTSHASKKRLSQRNSRRSESSASEDSQILYISALKTPKTRKQIGRSLSSIGNGAGRRIDGLIHNTSTEQQNLEDFRSRHVIDREIFEWQYVCQSGRPYWYSRQSKYARLQKLQHRMAIEHGPQTQMGTLKTVSKMQSDIRRQTVSDSYVADPTSVHDLAHLVAVQLLGACFTLPPDSITAMTPEYTRDDDGASVLRDPQLISSLRMHTHFRYSPSFGHQARNTSPVQAWPGRFDGSKSGSPRDRRGTGSSTPNIGTSSPCSHGPVMGRALQNTEGSETWPAGDDDEEDYIRTCCNSSELDPTVAACAWYRREGVRDLNSCSFTLPRLPGATSRHSTTHTPERSREEHIIPRSSTGPSVARTKYRLRPMIRAEPHHVFIQPVRELVVKRWRKVRRRFGGSLHSSLPTGRSEDASTLR